VLSYGAEVANSVGNYISLRANGPIMNGSSGLIEALEPVATLSASGNQRAMNLNEDSCLRWTELGGNALSARSIFLQLLEILPIKQIAGVW